MLCEVELLRDGLAKVFEYLYGSPDSDDGLMNRVGSACSLFSTRKGRPSLILSSCMALSSRYTGKFVSLDE